MGENECPGCGREASTWGSRCDECGFNFGLTGVPRAPDEPNPVLDFAGAVGGFFFGMLGGLAGGIVDELAKDAQRSQDEYRLRRTIEEAIRQSE